MIRIVRPAAPAALKTNGAAATLQNCRDHDASPEDYRSGVKSFQFDKAVYASKAVKTALIAAQQKKCAFCESHLLHVAHGDIEHFRPKKGFVAREGETLQRPGYYWLAYSWENLLFCCQKCNQSSKKNHFPLKDNRKRARPHLRNTDREEPLLIDPSAVDPSNFISFNQEYAFAVGDCLEGLTTIRLLGLNREDLLEVRRERLETLRRLEQIRSLLHAKIAASATPALRAELRAIDDSIERARSNLGVYSAMAQAIFG